MQTYPVLAVSFSLVHDPLLLGLDSNLFPDLIEVSSQTEGLKFLDLFLCGVAIRGMLGDWGSFCSEHYCLHEKDLRRRNHETRAEDCKRQLELTRACCNRGCSGWCIGCLGHRCRLWSGLARQGSRAGDEFHDF